VIHFPLSTKNIGIPVYRITLTGVSVLKSIVGLFLGLVLQLSQAQPHLATRIEQACAANMSCCKDLDSCPCVSESRGNEKPAPLLPAGADLKSFLTKAPEAPALETRISPAGGSRVALIFPAPFRNGYAGVPLSVAFCSFVI
jgi:hypothetical protein